jgi:8-oxo-dGTP pyrophosphatase MutT (NUDIX family)
MKNKFENVTGAGCVIYFDNTKNIIKNKPNEILYLVLINNNNKYDFPKGASDPFENELVCAIRETKEETNLEVNKNYIIDTNKSEIFSEGLVMFLANYILDFKDLDKEPDLGKNIKIIPTKVTDDYSVLEHKGFFWDSYDNIKHNFPLYLQEVLYWAKINIE